MRPKSVTGSQWRTYNTLFLLEHFLGEKRYAKIFGNTEKKLFKEIDEYVSGNGKPDDFRVIEYKKGEYTNPVPHPHYPVVFRGAADNWRCVKKWSFEYFADKYGDQDVTLVNNEGLVKDAQANEVVKFRDYVSMLKKGSKRYLKFLRIIDEQSTLQEDFDNAWLKKFRAPGSKNELHYFFMGGKDTITPIHCGLASTIFVEIAGTKKWLFYPANDYLFLGARPRRYNYFHSEADIYDTNNPKFPLLKYAQQREVLLYPGDVLYFPSFVWHQVENITDTIGFAYNYSAVQEGLAASKTLSLCLLLATKPWLIETFLPWRQDTVGYKKRGFSYPVIPELPDDQ